METKVTRMEDILGEKDTVEDAEVKKPNEKSKKKTSYLMPEIPKGKPKSGRIWKEQKTRFSSLVKTRGLHLSLKKKQKLREELKHVKEMSREIKAQKAADKEAKKERRRENIRRTEENRKKSEVVHVITNTAKLKKLKKKQLRMIEKRDTVNVQRK